MKNSGLIIGYLLFSLISFSGQSVLFEYPQKGKLDDLNRRSRFPIGVNAVFFGPVSGLAVTTDFFINPKVAIELGAGFRSLDFDHAFTIGARYHVFGKTLLSLTPYIGIYSAFHYNGSDLQNNSLYVPVGLHKIKKNGFSWSAELAWQRNTFFPNQFTGGFKVGYRFKVKK